MNAQQDDTASQWVVLCVDDEPNILSSLRRLFRTEGYKLLIAGSGSEGLQVCEKENVDLIISDMRMPQMDGAQFLEQVRARWPSTIRLLLTGYADIASTIDAINKGEIYRYISKPWNDTDIVLVVRDALARKGLERDKKRLEALTQRQNEELKTLNATLESKVIERTAALKQALDSLAGANEKLKMNFLTSIKVFSNLIEMRDGNLVGHSRRVADIARKIAMRLGLDHRETQDIFLAGLMHSIGKIGFPDALLSTPFNQLAGESLGQFRKHPVRGEQALMPLEDLRNVAKIVRSQHERFDGNGFPDALSGLAIPIGARILVVANDYDNMQIGMAVQRRVSAEDAKSFILQGRGKRYDPQVVDAFLALTGGVEPERPRELSISPADLKPGMVLTRDLITSDGVLLLTADYVLEDKLIQQIIDFQTAESEELKIYVRTDKGGHA